MKNLIKLATCLLTFGFMLASTPIYAETSCKSACKANCQPKKMEGKSAYDNCMNKCETHQCGKN